MKVNNQHREALCIILSGSEGSRPSEGKGVSCFPSGAFKADPERQRRMTLSTAWSRQGRCGRRDGSRQRRPA